MQKRIAKLYSFLFLTAFAFALALTACSDSNKNNNNPQSTDARLDMKVYLPDTEAKALSATQQILVYLLDADDKEVADSRVLYTAEGADPYFTDVNDIDEYVDHEKSGTDSRYVTFSYVTDYVGKPVTIMMEYYGENANDLIRVAYDEVTSLTAGTTKEVSSTAFTPVVAMYLACDPTKIVTKVNESTKVAVTMHAGDVAVDVTDKATYTLNPETLGTVKAGTFVAGSVAGTGKLTIAYGDCDAITVPVTVEEKTETKYTLVADFSNVTWKDEVKGAKINGQEAVVAEYKAALAEQSAGSYKVTLIRGEKEVTTTDYVKFEESAAKEGVITATLKDTDFVTTYNLVINYGNIAKSFNKDAVVAIVGDTVGNFELKEGYKAVYSGYEFYSTGKVSVNFIVNDGSTVAAETTTPVEFTVDQVEKSL